MTANTLKIVQRANVARGLLTLIAIVLIVAGFWSALSELVRRWNAQEEYSHGFLIPVVTLWLLWARRDALRANIGSPSWAGILLILLAFSMHIIGELSAVFILSQIGFVIALFGVVLCVGGYSLLKIAFLPIAFLLFAIPLPYFIDAELTLRLQLISSELGVFFIRSFGIPVYLDGNIIDMGNYKLQVVDACSGLRYLYPLLSLSFLAAYLFHAPLWQRCLVFLSSIPIAIGMNGLRIGLVGLLVDRWGTQMAEGLLHLFEGWVIFLACAVLLALEIYVLASLSRKKFFEVFYFPQISWQASNQFVSTPRGVYALTVCLVLLCVGGFAVRFVSGRSEVIQDRTRFVEFPDRIGLWRGHTDLLDPATEKALGFDDYILADYGGADGKTVNLYVAYYASQRKGESPHSPIVCIPGGGWAITNLRQTTYLNQGQPQPFNRVVIEKGTIKQIVYYWFDERGRKLANEWMAKIYLLTDAIVKNRTDGSLIRLTTQVSPGETEDDADRRLQGFMHDAIPKLADFLPTETPHESSVSYAPVGRQL